MVRIESTDHDVIPVLIAYSELPGSGIGIHVRLLFESIGSRTSTGHRFIKIIDAKEQYQAISRLSTGRTRQRRMVVGSPPVETKQHRAVIIKNLSEIVMSRRRLNLAEQLLVPPEAVSNVGHSDNCPDTFHNIL